MRNSILTFDTRAKQRFYDLADQAACHAQPGTDEAQRIIQVMRAVDTGALAVRDAHAALAQLRRDQQSRTREAA